MKTRIDDVSRRRFVAAGAGLTAALRAAFCQQGSYQDSNFSGAPIAGPFRPKWESLKAYRYPDWFRDAKFRIWAHWTPQCVPEQGDWYARGMYVQGSGQYNYHVKTYGHPSQFGYKDICHLWGAEHWNPEELIRLYARTGARYFVAIANHHDNFDCWNSKHQPWNCPAAAKIFGGLALASPDLPADHQAACMCLPSLTSSLGPAMHLKISNFRVQGVAS